MDTVLSSSTRLHFNYPIRTCPTTSASTTSHYSPFQKKKLFNPVRTVHFISHFSTSTVRKFTITCGSIAEISETQFRSTVLEANRPVLVEFVATWCGPCRLISPAMEWVAQEYGDRLMVVKIDHDANPRLIEEYKVYGLPTLILFKNGQEVQESRREGAITKVKLKEYVDALLDQISVS